MLKFMFPFRYVSLIHPLLQLLYFMNLLNFRAEVRAANTKITKHDMMGEDFRG